MPKIETIEASYAQLPPKKMFKASQAITKLKKAEVLRLQSDPDKRMRGLKSSVGRVASSNNLKIEP